MKRLLICALLLPAFGCGSALGSSAPVGTLMVTVTAGPVCPVQTPGQSGCSPRPVKGAHLRLEGPSDATIVTDAAGMAQADALAAGVYRVEPQPVQGLMNTPAPTRVKVTAGATARAVVTYDTGIR